MTAGGSPLMRLTKNYFGDCGTAALGCLERFRTTAGGCATSYSWNPAYRGLTGAWRA